MTFRGHISNGVVLLPNTGLPDGTQVEVTPLQNKASAASGAAILAAMEKLPKVPREWVDELDMSIASGRRPSSPPVMFADEREGGGSFRSATADPLRLTP